jgi:hypothetical protein
VDALDEVELDVLTEGWKIGVPIRYPYDVMVGRTYGPGRTKPHCRQAPIGTMASPKLVARDFHLPLR